MKRVFLGIDVQINRGVAWAALDEGRSMIGSGWLPQADAREVAAAALVVAQELEEKWESEVVVGIDAPRRPLDRPRQWYWDRGKRGWRPRRPSEAGHGRHCEVIIRSANLANPQWTRTGPESPEWMRLGFALFSAFAAEGIASHEVFPSASYRQLERDHSVRSTIDFSAFFRGPKDVLDAVVAALTVAEFVAGRGCEVGADALGSIVLPRPLPDGTPPELSIWPETNPAG